VLPKSDEPESRWHFTAPECLAMVIVPKSISKCSEPTLFAVFLCP
jgi:hypothetical protein